MYISNRCGFRYGIKQEAVEILQLSCRTKERIPLELCEATRWWFASTKIWTKCHFKPASEIRAVVSLKWTDHVASSSESLSNFYWNRRRQRQSFSAALAELLLIWTALTCTVRLPTLCIKDGQPSECSPYFAAWKPPTLKPPDHYSLSLGDH